MPAGRLVQRLAGADPEVRAAWAELLHRGRELGDDGGVVAVHGCGDTRADSDLRGRLSDRAEQRPGVA